jgi:ABC-type uncharacterized transport system permease subunit
MLFLAFNWERRRHVQWILRSLVYLLILLLFSQIFSSVHASEDRFVYLAVTQLVILGCRKITFSIEQDIQCRNWPTLMLLPSSYFLRKVEEGLGASLWSCAVLAVAACIFGPFCGIISWPPAGRIPLALLCGLLSLIIQLLMGFWIGLLTFWLRDVRNLYFLNLSATFLFGGLILPIDLYPAAFRHCCFLTPYPWILWAPASTIVNGTGQLLLKVGGALAWIGIFCWIAHRTMARLLQAIQLRG